MEKNRIHSTDFLFIALILCCLAIAMFMGCSNLKAQTRDSVGKVKHDTTYKVEHDSIFKVPVITQSSVIAAHYDNQISGWFLTASGQDAMIKWHLSNGDNRIYLYGIGGYLKDKTKWALIARFNDSCSAHGIKTGPAWSDPSQVTTDVDKFNKAQTKQSARFDLVIAELEPYNNILSYQLFWQYSRQVKTYCDANGLESIVYVGWHTQQSTDSMVVLYHMVNLHCYIQPDKMGTSYEYSYTRVRMEMFAAACVTMKVSSFPVTIIFSDENAFAYNYYVSNKGDFKAPYTAYVTAFNSLATTAVKSKLKVVGYTTFTSSYSLKIKPAMGLNVSTMRMAQSEKLTKKLLYVNPDNMKAKTIEVDMNLYNQTKQD